MELNIFKRDLVHTLYKDVENNLDLYENGNFDEILKKYTRFIKTVPNVTIDETIFSQFVPKSGGGNDAKNAFLLYNSFQNLNPYLAIDERIWVALCHQHAKDFVTERWLKKDLPHKKRLTSSKLISLLAVIEL